jgi:Spy/CpxP family protein refolding chaperone
MQRPQFVAALVVLGALIAGIALGVAGDRVAYESHRDRAPDSRTYWNRIGKEWGLTTEQRRVIDSLMDAQREKITAIYAPLHPSLDSAYARSRRVSDSTQEALRAILTPEQRQKLDAMRAEVRRREAEFRARRNEDLTKIR